MAGTDKKIARHLRKQLLIEVVTRMPVKDKKQKSKFLSYSEKKIRSIIDVYLAKFVRDEQKEFLDAVVQDEEDSNEQAGGISTLYVEPVVSQRGNQVVNA